MSRLLRGVVVQRIEDERAALATATNAVDSSPDPSADASSGPVESSNQDDQDEIPTWKRVLDLTLIAITYPIWLPVMLLVMAAIKISSPGPIFYRQERVGLVGGPS
jgi:lipopolysaccharide/colanic/teichoic acid biosynthesis glycosyltransferase